MSYEIWTAHRYGALFGHPETKVEDNLTEAQLVEWLRSDHGKLLHTLLVIEGEDGVRANTWLARYEKESK